MEHHEKRLAECRKKSLNLKPAPAKFTVSRLINQLLFKVENKTILKVVCSQNEANRNPEAAKFF